MENLICYIFEERGIFSVHFWLVAPPKKDDTLLV